MSSLIVYNTIKDYSLRTRTLVSRTNTRTNNTAERSGPENWMSGSGSGITEGCVSGNFHRSAQCFGLYTGLFINVGLPLFGAKLFPQAAYTWRNEGIGLRTFSWNTIFGSGSHVENFQHTELFDSTLWSVPTCRYCLTEWQAWLYTVHKNSRHYTSCNDRLHGCYYRTQGEGL